MFSRISMLVLVLLILAGCAFNRHIVAPFAKISLVGSSEMNPDAQGRPSPMSLKIYELSSRSAFDNLDFDTAFYNASTVLSDELLSAAEYVVLPEQQLNHRIRLTKNVRFIAIVAAYRHIDNAKWRLVYPVNENGYHHHEVHLKADAVVLD